jgi:hypothetical protein
MSDNATSLTVRCRLCEREFTVANAYARSKAKYCPECRAVVDAVRKRRAKARHNAGRERDSATLCGIDHGERDINRLIAEAKTKPDCVSDARWRIELRRRANKDYYNYCPAVVV